MGNSSYEAGVKEDLESRLYSFLKTIDDEQEQEEFYEEKQDKKRDESDLKELAKILSGIVKKYDRIADLITPEEPGLARAIARAAYKFNSDYAAEVVETLAVQKPENVIPVGEFLDKIIRYSAKKIIAMEATKILRDFAGQDAVEDVAFVLAGAVYYYFGWYFEEENLEKFRRITHLFKLYKDDSKTVNAVAKALRYVVMYDKDVITEVTEVLIDYSNAPEERIRAIALDLSEMFEHQITVDEDDIKVLKAYKNSEDSTFYAVTNALWSLNTAWDDEAECYLWGYWWEELSEAKKVLLAYAGSKNARKLADTIVLLPPDEGLFQSLLNYRAAEEDGILTEKDVSNILEALEEIAKKIRRTEWSGEAIIAVANYIHNRYLEGKAREAVSFSRRIVGSIKELYTITTFMELFEQIKEGLTEKDVNDLIEVFKGIEKSRDAVMVANYIHNRYLEGKARKAVSVLRRMVESTGESRAVIEFIKGQKFFSFVYN